MMDRPNYQFDGDCVYCQCQCYTESAEDTKQLVDLRVTGKQCFTCHLHTTHRHA